MRQRPNTLQQAVIVLKKYIKEHWSEDSNKHVPPVTRDNDKAFIRQHLPAGTPVVSLQYPRERVF